MQHNAELSRWLKYIISILQHNCWQNYCYLPHRGHPLAGLLEGAHTGTGLGHEFLRHTQRCRLLVHVVDGSSPDPIGDYKAIQTELELFNPELIDKPQVRVIPMPSPWGPYPVPNMVSCSLVSLMGRIKVTTLPLARMLFRNPDILPTSPWITFVGS